MNKNIIKIFSLLFLAILFAGCQKNANWVVVTEVQPGIYVSGEGTVYSGEAPASMLSTLSDIDAGEVTQGPTHLLHIDTWLRGGKEFTISIANTATDIQKYGKGEVISQSDAAEVYSLAAGTSLSVAEDGLYRIVVNTALMQVHILPLRWGVIGSATPKGWDGETALGTATYNEANFTAAYTATVRLSALEFKFRYSGNWGYEFQSTDTEKIKFHTNLGLSEKKSLNYKGGSETGSAGGENIVVPYEGEYQISIVYSLRTRKYEVEAKLIGEPTPPPAVTLPDQAFLIGSIVDWSWDKAIELIPVYGKVGAKAEGGTALFWGIKYLPAGAEIKFNHLKSWGKDFGYSAVSDTSKAFVGITDEKGNIKVGNGGWYLIVVSFKTSTDGTQLIPQADFFAPDVYLVGNTAGGVWSTPNDTKFTVPADASGRFESPAFAQDGELRISVGPLAGIDWWKTEFIILGGKIEYRGNGGDQERVNVSKGQKAYLSFGDNTGEIK